MSAIDDIKKVLGNYHIVKDNEPLDIRLIDRVARIIDKEFDVKLKFDIDDGPVDLAAPSTSTAVVPPPPPPPPPPTTQTSSTAVTSRAIVPGEKVAGDSPQQQHFARQINEQKAKVLNAIRAAQNEDKDIVDIEGEPGEDGVEAVEDPLASIPGTRPTRMSQVKEERKGSSNSIRRLSG